MSDTSNLDRYYFVTVIPLKVAALDEGMTLKVLLPAANPRQARRRVARYCPGRIQAVQLVKWTGGEKDRRRQWIGAISCGQ